jgi:tRNA (guanine37-N1)-methyltransferase
MVVVEAVTRLVPGVVAKSESVENESFSDKEAVLKEHPQYTRPEVIKVRRKSFGKLRTKKLRVPSVLLTGNHKKIEEWRRKNSK